MLKITGFLCPLYIMLLVATMAHAGGVAPGDEPPQAPMVREKVTASPAQTATAVSKARRAVAPAVTPTPKQTAPAKAAAPAVKEVPMPSIKPKGVPMADKDSWLLGSREGECAPLSSVSRKVKNIGTFNTPQEFSRQMQQRGYQAFVLDIGDMRDQVIRVKVPDLDLDLTFVKAGMCR